MPLSRLRVAAEELATLSTDNLRAEVKTEWERTLSIMESGNTPPSLDLFAPYLVPSPTTLADYVGADALLVLDDPAAIDLIGSQLGHQAEELRDAFVSNGELPAGLSSPVVAWSTVRKTLAKRRSLALGTAWKGDKRRVFEVGVVDPPRFAGRLADVVDSVRERLFDGWRVVLATDQVDRLTELFEERDIFPRRERRRDASLAPTPLSPGTLAIRSSDLIAAGLRPKLNSSCLPISNSSVFANRCDAHIGDVMPNPVLWPRASARVTTSSTSIMASAFFAVWFAWRQVESNVSTCSWITPRVTDSTYLSTRPTV